ncbi:MAG: hypothetical protein ACI4KB_02475 [Oscillospiraceae bacterium]|nr:hypothetical protein [Oscillospiraceae bacterium]
MKNAIIMVSILCAVIIFTVLILSSAMENPEKNYNESENYGYSDLLKDADFELVIVTSEKNFWDRVAALKATEAPEFIAVTDEEGNPVTDENGNEVTCTAEIQYDENSGMTGITDEESDNPVTEIPDQENENPVTEIPDEKQR